VNSKAYAGSGHKTTTHHKLKLKKDLCKPLRPD